jgi:hypothetical protein
MWVGLVTDPAGIAGWHEDKETLRSWRVSLLRSRAIPLGTVQAPDERSAEAAAVAQFGLDDGQRGRLAVREEE